MKVEYDIKAKALYIKFLERGENGKTEDLIKDEVILDKTQFQQIAGIKILNVEEIKLLNYD